MLDEAKCELVREWLVKAENDLEGARLLSTAGEDLLENALFHCQQAFEKAVKAFLVFHDTRFQKKHDLLYLINEAKTLAHGFAAFEDESEFLTPFATVYRYPGSEESFDFEHFKKGIELADRLYQFVLSLLPPEVYPPS